MVQGISNMLEETKERLPNGPPEEAKADKAGDKTEAARKGAAPALALGSDVEMAGALVARLRERCRDHVVSDNGSLYGWTGTRWKAVPDDLVRRLVHEFDGAVYEWTAQGNPKQVRLTKARVDSIIYEAGAMLGTGAASVTGEHIVNDDDHDMHGASFFDGAAVGINCASGFIRIDAEGGVDLLPHDPDHRQRHTLTAAWAPQAYDGCSDFSLPEGSALHRLLEGVFRGDPDAQEKADLLQEVAGCAVARHGTRLKKGQFVLLYGPSADNGKSQILDMLSSLFPPHAVGAVSVEDWGDERHRASLQDVALNAVGELQGRSIVSAHFKAIVSGDRISARDVYRSAVGFRPTAVHVAASNKLPSFEGGVDRGVRARLLPIAFNRSIPRAEQEEGIGQRIAREEAALLLAWAVEGARRVVPRGAYAVPDSCRDALAAWAQGADPVLDWLAEAVKVDPSATGVVGAAELFNAFREWARADGHSDRHLPGPREFGSRLEAQPGVARARTEHARGFRGLRLVSGGGRSDPDVPW